MRPAFQSVNQGGHELINLEKNKQQSIILETLDRVNKNWQALAIKLLNTTAKFDELQEQSEKFYAVYKHVILWLDNMEVRQLSMPPVGLDPDVLSVQMKEQKVLWDFVSNFVFITFLSVLLNKFNNYESKPSSLLNVSGSLFSYDREETTKKVCQLTNLLLHKVLLP